MFITMLKQQSNLKTKSKDHAKILRSKTKMGTKKKSRNFENGCMDVKIENGNKKGENLQMFV